MKGLKEQRVIPKISISSNNPDIGPGLLLIDIFFT